MQADSGLPLSSLRIDGGLTKNALAMQFLSDLLDSPLQCARVNETTALGAACVAGLAVKIWASQEELRSLWKPSTSFSPSMDAATRDNKVIGNL